MSTLPPIDHVGELSTINKPPFNSENTSDDSVAVNIDLTQHTQKDLPEYQNPGPQSNVNWNKVRNKMDQTVQSNSQVSELILRVDSWCDENALSPILGLNNLQHVTLLGVHHNVGVDYFHCFGPKNWASLDFLPSSVTSIKMKQATISAKALDALARFPYLTSVTFEACLSHEDLNAENVWRPTKQELKGDQEFALILEGKKSIKEVFQEDGSLDNLGFSESEAAEFISNLNERLEEIRKEDHPRECQKREMLPPQGTHLSPTFKQSPVRSITLGRDVCFTTPFLVSLPQGLEELQTS